jgi:hypothetical protein
MTRTIVSVNTDPSEGGFTGTKAGAPRVSGRGQGQPDDLVLGQGQSIRMELIEVTIEALT